MPWDEIEGQDRAVRLLRRAVARGQLHHAYLVVGPEGVGKELLARLLAQAANCEAEGAAGAAAGPCGSCAACKAVLRGVHPDVITVRPQSELVARGQLNKGDLESAPSREIRVDEVRQLARRLSFALVRGRRKIALVAPAEALNERAQNALLKTLEEPPEGTTFLLVTAQPDLLLPTVRSRCQRLTLLPLAEEAIAGRLLAQGVPEAAARARAARAEGSLGRALRLTAEEIARHDQLLHRLESTLHAADEREALDLAEELGERDPAVQAVEVLAERTRQLLVREARGEPAPLPATGLLQQHDLCAEVLRALEQNGNARLQLERLLLGLRELRDPAPSLRAAGGAHV
jgi:DNA polymerase-3 subunit delta'